MYEVLILVAIIATAATTLTYVYLRIHELPTTDSKQDSKQDPGPALADREMVARIRLLFLMLFAVAISLLALSIYTTLHRADINPRLPGLESRLDATRSRIEATESKVEATQSQVTQAQAAISRIEQMIATITPPTTANAWLGFNRYGVVLVGLLVLGLALLLVGFFVDYARAKPDGATQTVAASSKWATLLKDAAMFKIAGSFCLISSVTLASFKIEKVFSFEMRESPAELHVELQHFVNEIVSITPPDPPKKDAPKEPPPKPDPPETPKPVVTTPPTVQVRSTDVDCGQPSDPDKFVLKTFALGKEDEFEGMNPSETQAKVKTRLQEILDDIEASAKVRELQGLVFVGSADRLALGRITREHYSTNSTLARKRAEYVRQALLAQLELRQNAPRPRWVLLLNPDLPKVRLTIEDGKQFNALRAVQICVAWTRKSEREASRGDSR